MLYCDVLMGVYTTGTPEMLEPPVIDDSLSKTDNYDSTVDNLANPAIYVSYRDNMAYPSYLIIFKL